MLEKMSLVVAMDNNLRAGLKISEDDFAAAYGQLIQSYPQIAIESLEKMVGAFFEVRFIFYYLNYFFHNVDVLIFTSPRNHLVPMYSYKGAFID